MQDRAPVITESAADDERLASGSVRMQKVRSAICAPLLTGDQSSIVQQPEASSQQPGSVVLGALYADTITRPTPFSEEEAAALMAFAGLAAVAIARARLAEEAARERELRRGFERFFAPSVAETIATRGGADVLAGSRREAAVLFGDIRGFTALTEHITPEETARLLADYLAVAVDVIFEHGGTLDKFVGDAVMAVWGAPLSREDAADRALAAARAIHAELAALNTRRRREGLPEITAGVGISYGSVFAGNVGSERRLEYTVVGDPVNVASRLCATAAPGEILLTEDVVIRLADPGPLERVGELDVRGRTGKVVAYRVMTR
jgi:adenylate cyclase